MVSLPDPDASGGMDLFAPPAVLGDPCEPVAKRLKFSPDSVGSDSSLKMLGLVWYPVECRMQTLNITCKHTHTHRKAKVVEENFGTSKEFMLWQELHWGPSRNSQHHELEREFRFHGE